jgi:hypothetical protein
VPYESPTPGTWIEHEPGRLHPRTRLRLPRRPGPTRQLGRRSIQDETGIKPEGAAEAFPDLAGDVRQSINRIKSSLFIPKKDSVRGFVLDMATGKLDEVAA